MKRIFVLLAFLAVAAVSANAQFRVEAGVNFGSYKFDNKSLDSKPAVKAAVYYGFFGDRNGDLEMGLAYTQYKIGNSENNATMTISNIQLPVRGTYTLDITDNFSIVGVIGLYAGYAFDGKTVISDSITNNPFEGEGGMKRWDFGTDDGVYVRLMNRFSIGIGYQDSFRNLCKSDSINVKGDAISFTLGYIF